MRVFECDGLDAEALAEVEGGGTDREAADVNPQIELVARPPTTEAVEEIAVNVNGEAPIVCRANAVGAEWTGTAPLRTTPNDGLVSEKIQHAADGDPAADGRIVEVAHYLRPLVPPFLVFPR